MSDYLDRFPATARDHVERAYQDGFADGAASADEVSELRAAGYYIAPCGASRWKASHLAPGALTEVCVAYAATEADAIATCLAHIARA